MLRSLVGGLVACIACIAGAQQPACTAPDMAPIRALAQSVQDAGLRRQVNLLLDARIEDVVRRSGGRDGFERFIAGNITALESRRSGADAKLDADLRAAIAIQRAVGASAQCILPSGDPRTPLQRAGAGLPVSAVGMVRKQLGQGSGTLVSRCLVVTNEHVVSKGGAIEVAVGDAVTFYAGSGRFEGFAEWVRAEIVALGARRSTGRLSDDWTVLRLDRPLGDRYGWIEVATVPPESRPSLPLWALGFPNDGVAIAGGFTQLWSHRGCRFLAEDGHRWASDCVANVERLPHEPGVFSHERVVQPAFLNYITVPLPDRATDRAKVLR